MPVHIRNLEWADHNGQRAYPLAVEASRWDLSQSFRLPNDFLIGLQLAVGVGLGWRPDRFYLKSFGNHATGFGLTIGYDDGDGGVPVATANVARGAHSPYQWYRLTGIGDFLDATGHVQLGELSGVDDQPGGQFEFDRAGGQIEADAIRPQIRSIQSFRVINGGSSSERIYGDVEFVAGRNMKISVETIDETTTLTFNAIDGEGLNESCVCDGSVELTPIRTINGIPGTPEGDFVLLGNNCLQWEEIAHGLRANDVCSEPCCGCRELEIVTEQLETFSRQARTLETFIVELEARVTQMDQTVLASRLGDRGCAACD